MKLPELKLNLLPFQKRAVEQYREAFNSGRRDALLTAIPGAGKTYMGIAMLDVILRSEWYRERSANIPFPCFFVVMKNARIQIQRVVKESGLGGHIFVTTPTALRSKKGELWMDWRTIVKNGQEIIRPFWDLDNAPCVMLFDECQLYKNQGAQQTLVAESYQEVPDTTQIFMSATPGEKVNDMRIVCSALKFPIYDGHSHMSIANFPSFANGISWGEPDKPHPVAMKRLKDRIKDYHVNVTRIHFKKKAKIICQRIEFLNHEHQIIYGNLFEEYQKARIAKDKDPLHGFAAYVVALLKFRQGSEILRAEQIAAAALEQVANGKQVIVGSSFIDSLTKIFSILLEKSIPASRLGMIVGGQSDEERQRNIDAFQEGKSDVILVSAKAGGTCLSLHHDRECARPRIVILPPVWSAIELVQFLGRGHRVTSISDTLQIILWYKNTVEEDVAAKVEAKKNSMRELVGSGESWASVFDKGVIDAEKDINIEEELLKLLKEGAEDDDVGELDADTVGDMFGEQEKEEVVA